MHKAHCFECGWGLTLDNIGNLVTDAQRHLREGCPGPIVTLSKLGNLLRVTGDSVVVLEEGGELPY